MTPFLCEVVPQFWIVLAFSPLVNPFFWTHLSEILKKRHFSPYFVVFSEREWRHLRYDFLITFRQITKRIRLLDTVTQICKIYDFSIFVKYIVPICWITLGENIPSICCLIGSPLKTLGLLFFFLLIRLRYTHFPLLSI